MTHVQAVLAGWSGALVAIALFAGWRERRRNRRSDPDAVGLIAWPTVQVLALLGLAVCGLLAFGSG